jgi:multimeric flavodoxin WrbA
MLLEEVLKGAASKGAETKFIAINKMNITPCQHCDSCLKDGECAIKDDMQDLYKEVERSDVIVLASPIQFMGVTAPMKAFIDRFQSRWVRKYVLKRPPLGDEKKRKGFFVSVGGTKLKNLFEPALVMVKSFFLILNVEYAGELVFKGIDEKGAIANHPDALKQAFTAGQKLVED